MHPPLQLGERDEGGGLKFFEKSLLGGGGLKILGLGGLLIWGVGYFCWGGVITPLHAMEQIYKLLFSLFYLNIFSLENQQAQ